MSTLGVDISFYQGDFDFKKAMKEGVKYVVIKCGESTYKDPKFERNYSAAKSAGMPVGAYYLGHAATLEEAKAECAFCTSYLKGKQFEYPIFYDVEDSRMGSAGKDKLTEIVRTFCEGMENAGYWCGFYTNLDWYTNKLRGAGLAKRFSFWFAYWDKKMFDLPDVQMWQQGAKMIAGVNTDYNYCFKDYPALIKAKGLNGYKKSTTAQATPKPKAVAAQTSELKPGDKIKIASGAVVYGTKDKFAPFVYNATYYIREVNGNRIVFAPKMSGNVTGAVDKKYVKKA